MMIDDDVGNNDVLDDHGIWCDGDGNDDDERGVNHYNKFRTLQKIPPKNPKISKNP